MIQVDYSDGQIKIKTQDLDRVLSSDQLPLKFDIKKAISAIFTNFFFIEFY